MADVSGITRVSDVLVPDVWVPYVQERTATLSAIRTSGIAATVTLPAFNGGKTVNMPHWQDITGDDEVWSSGHETVPQKITASKDVAAVLTRIKSWGAEDLAGMFAGSDPMGALANLVAPYWARKEQGVVLADLKGIYASGTLDDNYAEFDTELLSHTLMVDAISRMGDASTSLTAIVCHSAVMFDLAKKRLLDVKPTEPGTTSAPEFSTFLGRRIIVDDGCPVETVGDNKVYTTYFFGAGAFAFAEGTPTNPVEFQRVGTQSLDILINRRQFIMHPRGVKWIGNAANDTPSNAELATGTNWQRVFEPKNIPIVALRCQIG